MGAHEVVEEELPGVRSGVDGEKTKFWRPAKGAFLEGRPEKDSYLSVNAMTIEAGQEGADLIDWADRKTISYVDALGLTGKPFGIADKPFGGRLLLRRNMSADCPYDREGQTTSQCSSVI